jgi:hypothetical protein
MRGGQGINKDGRSDVLGAILVGVALAARGSGFLMVSCFLMNS